MARAVAWEALQVAREPREPAVARGVLNATAGVMSSTAMGLGS